MATVHDILVRKGSEVIALPPGASVRAAADLMNERGVGGVVVLDGGRLAGIFTERDVLRKIVAAGRDPATTKLEEVMSAPVLTCPASMVVEECAALMTARRLRHLPVQGNGDELLGVVTIGDVLAWQLGEHEATIQYMNSYIHDLR